MLVVATFLVLAKHIYSLIGKKIKNFPNRSLLFIKENSAKTKLKLNIFLLG
jgi:hypothetical protein